MIYCVTFHRKPRRKLFNFWFTDRKKALAFYNSVKAFPKVIDTSFGCVPECSAESYEDTLTDPTFVTIDYMTRV